MSRFKSFRESPTPPITCFMKILMVSHGADELPLYSFRSTLHTQLHQETSGQTPQTAFLKLGDPARGRPPRVFYEFSLSGSSVFLGGWT